MALSGSQVTQHGVSGYTQIRYSSFAGKDAQALFADIEGLVTYLDMTRTIVCADLTPRRKCDELL